MVTCACLDIQGGAGLQGKGTIMRNATEVRIIYHQTPEGDAGPVPLNVPSAWSLINTCCETTSMVAG